MVGSAIVRCLNRIGCHDLVLRTRAELDLLNQAAVEEFFQLERPDTVVFAAGLVGGIQANRSRPADFFFENTIAAVNTIRAAFNSATKRFLFLGSTCIYPRLATQPIEERSLLSGPLEETNEAYAIAKISGLKYCQYLRQQHGVLFHSAMPTNLYGPGDNYHVEDSHVLPGLIRRFHDAKVDGADVVQIWGSGKPRREFLHVDDLATAVVHLLSVDDPPDWVNVGTGQDCSILEIARLVAEVVGYQGRIAFDASRPDGTPRKLTDNSRLTSTGWSPSIELKPGLQSTYESFLSELNNGTLRT